MEFIDRIDRSSIDYRTTGESLSFAASFDSPSRKEELIKKITVISSVWDVFKDALSPEESISILYGFRGSALESVTYTHTSESGGITEHSYSVVADSVLACLSDSLKAAVSFCSLLF